MMIPEEQVFITSANQCFVQGNLAEAEAKV